MLKWALSSKHRFPHGCVATRFPSAMCPATNRRMNPMRVWTASLCCALLMLNGCNRNESGSASNGKARAGKKPKVAYITNGVDPFWNTARAGMAAAAKEFDVDAIFEAPPKGTIDQKRIVESLLTSGIDGIAISPVDAKNQVDLINQACAVTKVITHDSDAPDSKRLCFVGMDNYKAGRAAGRLVKEAI